MFSTSLDAVLLFSILAVLLAKQGTYGCKSYEIKNGPIVGPFSIIYLGGIYGL